VQNEQVWVADERHIVTDRITLARMIMDAALDKVSRLQITVKVSGVILRKERLTYDHKCRIDK
jgi:hypothetical protein